LSSFLCDMRQNFEKFDIIILENMFKRFL